MLQGLLFAFITSLMPAQFQPHGPIPSPRQLAWQQMDTYAFVHFGPNTFTDVEWGHGAEDPKVFAPKKLDCRQWAQVFKQSGMKAVILTAKHHDGFCLWPSKYSTHTVAATDHKRDVLGELAAACKEFGLKLGIYLSPWDRNHPHYGSEKYNETFALMIEEVLTQYGQVHEFWFDGANGEGPNGKRQVYHWPRFHAAVRKHAPDAVMFSDAGPDIRWVGNEAGHSAPTCWSTIDRDRYVPGTNLSAELTEGKDGGTHWVPAECDVSIRPGWFYHAAEDARVKSPAQLMDLYERSVGQNGSLLLNVPPNRDGLIAEPDIKSLMAFRQLREQTYGKPVAGKLSGAATSEFSADHAAGKAVDGNANSFWAAKEGVVRASLTLTRSTEAPFDRILIREPIVYGQRVRKFQVRTEDGAVLATGTTIGNKRMLRVRPTMSRKLTLEIEDARACPAISEFSLHATPSLQEAAPTYSKQASDPLNETKAQKDKRMAWWREARFGMFIHWGLYAVPAGEWGGKNIGGAGEWILNSAQIKVADYEPLIKQFNPVRYDPKEWVRIAKDAGMKYIVITSKHHEGWGLFDSKFSDWDVMSTPYKKDLLKQLAEACKEAGIVLCFYHSIMDWHHPDYLPRRAWDPRPEVKAEFNRYVTFMKNQLKELLTNYGKIGILWFDGEWEHTWTHERGVDLYRYVRSLQPDIIVNNRVDTYRSGMAGLSSSDQAVGDYGTPEQEIPGNGLPGVDWESCMTMNDTWGFHKNDHNWKSAEKLIQNLVDCASKGGNYLLNVGPTALGEIPLPSVERLRAVGAWLRVNGEAIYGTQAGPFVKPLPWGRVTQRPGKLYLHVFDPKVSEIDLPGLQAKIKSVRELGGSGGAVSYRQDGDIVRVQVMPSGIAGQLAPLGPKVLVMEVTGPASAVPIPIQQAADGNVVLTALDATVKGQTAQYEESKRAIGYWTNVKDTVSWEFSLKTPGDYEVHLDWACDPPSAGSTVEIRIAGKALRTTIKPTASWAVFQVEMVGSVTLGNAGKVQVQVVPIQKPGLAVMNLRAIRLLPVKR